MSEIDRLTRAEFINNELQEMIREMETSYEKREAFLQEFIDEELWKELGHESFKDYWNEIVGSTRLGGPVRDMVIKQLTSDGVGIKETARATGSDRNTVRKVVRGGGEFHPPVTSQPPLEPTDILDPIEDDYTEEDAKRFEEQVRKELAEKKTVPFDIPNDVGIFLATESVTGHLNIVKRRASRGIDSKTKAKLLAELDAFEETINEIRDTIENML